MGDTWICDLIRHGDAGDRHDWPGDDRDRPLSAKGVRQAEALVGLLEEPPGSLLISSPAARCRQTLAPIGRALSVGVVTNDLCAEGQDPAEVADLILSAGRRVVICTHGDIIGGLIFDLMNAGLAERSARFSKASTWRLTCTSNEFIGAEYIPPP